jgi:hypothetical protein
VTAPRPVHHARRRRRAPLLPWARESALMVWQFGLGKAHRCSPVFWIRLIRQLHTARRRNAQKGAPGRRAGAK